MHSLGRAPHSHPQSTRFLRHYRRQSLQAPWRADKSITTNIYKQSSLSAACAKRSLGSGRQFYIYRGDNRTKSSLNANQIHHRYPDANVYMFAYTGWCARLIKTLLPAGDVYLSLSAGAAVLSDSCATSGTRMEWKRRKQTRPNGADNFANEPVVIAALHFYCTGVCLWVCVGSGQIEAPTTLSKKTCSKREFLSVEWY